MSKYLKNIMRENANITKATRSNKETRKTRVKRIYIYVCIPLKLNLYFV